MKPLLTLLVLAFALIRIRRVPGFKLRFNRSNRTFGLVVGTLVVLALLVAINPETRIFLLFLDSFGVDLFVALCALFVRHNLELCVAILLIPILKGIYRWGPVPGFWPSGVVLKSSASWAGYAVLYPAAALFMGVLFVRCMFFGVWT
jgi:hypothetical protein